MTTCVRKSASDHLYLHAGATLRGLVLCLGCIAAFACDPKPTTQPEPLQPEVHVDDHAPPPTADGVDESGPDSAVEHPETPGDDSGIGDPQPATPGDSSPEPVDNGEPEGALVCDGKYRAGEVFKRDCNTCSCAENGQIRCTLMACLPATKR